MWGSSFDSFDSIMKPWGDSSESGSFGEIFLARHVHHHHHHREINDGDLVIRILLMTVIFDLWGRDVSLSSIWLRPAAARTGLCQAFRAVGGFL